MMAKDKEVDKIRTAEPGIPNIGGMDGPDRPPPADGVEAPVPDTPLSSREIPKSPSMRSNRSSGEPSPAGETWADGDESLTEPGSEGSPSTGTHSPNRSRSSRRGISSSVPVSPQRSKRGRPPSLTARGAVKHRRHGKANQATPGLPEQGSENDPTARSSHDPVLPIAEPHSDAGEELDDLPDLTDI